MSMTQHKIILEELEAIQIFSSTFNSPIISTSYGIFFPRCPFARTSELVRVVFDRVSIGLFMLKKKNTLVLWTQKKCFPSE